MRRVMMAAALFFVVSAVRGSEIDDALATLRNVGREGGGNEKAAAQWKQIVQQGPKALPSLLTAFEGADATAANWLRTAVEAIAENEQRAGRPLPAGELEAFVKDVKRSHRGREMAYEILLQGDPAARRRLLPAMRDDPSAWLRREAITLALEEIEAKGGKQADALKALFAQARDVNQVEKIAKELKAAGVEVDVLGHLNLITRWQIAGPFDNSKLKGFFAELPTKVEWKDFATAQERGVVDLYTATGKKRGVDPMSKTKDAVYALARTEIESPEERPAEIRAATQNAIRIYFNGKEVFSREEYHHGTNMDQHAAAVRLKKGRNEILIKVCQDDMTFEWTLPWAFQLRVCDAIGGAVPIKVLTAPNAIPVQPEPPKKEPMK